MQFKRSRAFADEISDVLLSSPRTCFPDPRPCSSKPPSPFFPTQDAWPSYQNAGASWGTLEDNIANMVMTAQTVQLGFLEERGDLWRPNLPNPKHGHEGTDVR